METTATNILNAGSPEQLYYAILTSNKSLFTKQELLTIIAKVDQMYKPTFPEPCEYIN